MTGPGRIQSILHSRFLRSCTEHPGARRLAKRLLALALLVLILDLAAGIALNDRENHKTTIRRYHSYYHHGLRANMEAVEPWTPSQQYFLYTNSLGFRDGANGTRPARIDKRRIIFLGDSFTEGVGVPFGDTFVGIIEKQLWPRIDVLNAAVVSYGATNYYLKMKYMIEKFGLEFSDLIVFSDISDVYNDYALHVIQGFTPRLSVSFFDRIRMGIDRALNNYSFLYHSYKMIYPYVKLRKYEVSFAWWTLNDAVYNDWGKIGLSLSEEYMQRLVDLCKEKGARMTIVVYPWPNLIEARDLNSRQVVFWRDFASRNDIGFIDLFPLFINETPSQEILDRYFLSGDVHWSKDGHRLVARSIFKSMEQDIMAARLGNGKDD